jgi:hypothetical protein
MMSIAPVGPALVGKLILENQRITVPNLFGALWLSIGTQQWARQHELHLYCVKMFELMLKWNKRISVFSE